MNKDTIIKVAYAALVFVLAVAAAFGYDVGVVQPREAARDMLVDPDAQSSRAAGVNVRTEKALVVENYIEDNGTLNVDGATTLSGGVTLAGTQAIGDGTGTVTINSSDWDVSATGAMTGIGAVTTDGLATLALGATVSGATTSINASSNFATNLNTGTSTGALALGGGSGTVAVNSSDWDISTTGDMTGIGALTSNGLATLALGATVSGATTSINADSNFGTNLNTGSSTGAVAIGGNGGTVAVNSSDWDINATGDMTGIGAITSNGLATLALGATVSGATTSLNADSNFGTNINTGTSTGAVAIGGGLGTVAINSSDWDINATGDMTGIGAITSNGLATLALGATVSGATSSINTDSNFGTNLNTGSSTGAVAIGGGLGTVAINSSDWDIDATGAATGIGAVTMDGALTASAGATLSGGDVTLSADATGGNAGAKSEFIGLPRLKLVGLGQGTNPASQTISLFDDTPDGEFAPVTGTVTETLNAVYYKYGTKSYGVQWGAEAVATDGIIDANLGAAAAWDDMESAGLLVYSTATWASGDLTLVLTDDGGARTFAIPALTVADKWTWLEVDIATGDLSAVSDVAILLSAQGETALSAFTMYLDVGWVWDSVDEDALGVAIQQDGILSCVNAENGATLADQTDYIVHYESGVDFLVWITDQSAADAVCLAAY